MISAVRLSNIIKEWAVASFVREEGGEPKFSNMFLEKNILWKQIINQITKSVECACFLGQTSQ